MHTRNCHERLTVIPRFFDNMAVLRESQILNNNVMTGNELHYTGRDIGIFEIL